MLPGSLRPALDIRATSWIVKPTTWPQSHQLSGDRRLLEPWWSWLPQNQASLGYHKRISRIFDDVLNIERI